MVEMRWIERKEHCDWGYVMARVLQYRFRAPVMSTGIHAFPPRDWEWSEWQDVPEPEVA